MSLNQALRLKIAQQEKKNIVDIHNKKTIKWKPQKIYKFKHFTQN